MSNVTIELLSYFELLRITWNYLDLSSYRVIELSEVIWSYRVMELSSYLELSGVIWSYRGLSSYRVIELSGVTWSYRELQIYLVMVSCLELSKVMELASYRVPARQAHLMIRSRDPFP